MPINAALALCLPSRATLVSGGVHGVSGFAVAVREQWARDGRLGRKIVINVGKLGVQRWEFRLGCAA